MPTLRAAVQNHITIADFDAFVEERHHSLAEPHLQKIKNSDSQGIFSDVKSPRAQKPNNSLKSIYQIVVTSGDTTRSGFSRGRGSDARASLQETDGQPVW
jgi:hypothetical protein